MKLEKLRAEINKIDKDIVLLLGRRFKLVKKVASFKKKNNLLMEDKSREKEVIKKVKQVGSDIGVDSAWLTKVFRLIIKESKKEQKTIQDRIDIYDPGS